MEKIAGAHVALIVPGLEAGTFDLVLNQRAQLFEGRKIYEVQGGGIEKTDASAYDAAVREMFEELQMERFYPNPSAMLSSTNAFKHIMDRVLPVEGKGYDLYLVILLATEEIGAQLREPFEPSNEVDFLYFHDIRKELPENMSRASKKYFVQLIATVQEQLLNSTVCSN